jgi:hypothetical protein
MDTPLTPRTTTTKGSGVRTVLVILRVVIVVIVVILCVVIVVIFRVIIVVIFRVIDIVIVLVDWGDDLFVIFVDRFELIVWRFRDSLLSRFRRPSITRVPANAESLVGT